MYAVKTCRKKSKREARIKMERKKYEKRIFIGGSGIYYV